MANELRIRQLAIGGLVENNPLAIGDGTLASAALAAVTGGVGSTQHLAIVLDPDGVDGAPEVAYVSALTNGAGSGTILRGQEGTIARAHDAGTPWVHAPTLRDCVRHTSAVRTAGNLTLNSLTMANVDTALDLVLPAFVGDVVEVGISAYMANDAVICYLDAVSLVAGSPVNSWGIRAAAPSLFGIATWTGPASLDARVGPPVHKTLLAGDLSSGTVTLRLRYMTASAANKVLRANTNELLEFWAKNLGPATA